MRDYSLAMIIAIFVIALLTYQMLIIQMNVAAEIFRHFPENAKRLAMLIHVIMQSANVMMDGLETNVKFHVRILKSPFKHLN